jgi:outer membrane protein OmpA-like peptidoglycan-associated protein
LGFFWLSAVFFLLSPALVYGQDAIWESDQNKAPTKSFRPVANQGPKIDSVLEPASNDQGANNSTSSGHLSKAQIIHSASDVDESLETEKKSPGKESKESNLAAPTPESIENQTPMQSGLKFLFSPNQDQSPPPKTQAQSSSPKGAQESGTSDNDSESLKTSPPEPNNLEKENSEPKSGPSLGQSADNLDPSQIEEALKGDPNQPIEVHGLRYVWKDHFLYQQLPDGSLKLADGFLQGDDTILDEDGQQWLTQDAEGNAFIKVSLKVWATINFEYNSAEITPDSEKVLETFGHALNRPGLAKRRLLVSGHTDNVGSKEFNLKLSRRRAASVAKWLVEKAKIEANRLVLAGYGDEAPIASNETEAGQAQNRRVEFVLLQ